MRLEVKLNDEVIPGASVRTEQMHGYIDVEIHHGDRQKIELRYGAVRHESDGTITFLPRRGERPEGTLTLRQLP